MEIIRCIFLSVVYLGLVVFAQRKELWDCLCCIGLMIFIVGVYQER